MGDRADDQEKLFLLEVLVDSVFTSNSSLNLDRNTIANLADTCVLFQFLHYPPLVVCESDFIGTPAGRQDASSITFKSGKSCFFSLRLPRGLVKPVPFDVNVSVSRKLKTGQQEAVDIGRTCVSMGEMFTELLRQNVEEECDSQPLSRTKKGVFELKDASGRTVGNLVAFLRISCFGKLIITQFSLNKEDKKSFLFKGTDMTNLCTTEEGRPCGEKLAGVSGSNSGRKSVPTDKPGRASMQGYEHGMTKTVTSCGEDRGNFQSRLDEGKGQYQSQMQGGTCRCSMDDGYAPTPFYPPISYSAPSATYGPPPPSRGYGGTGGGALCECPYPVPPSVMSKYNQRSRQAEKNMDLAPGEVGMQDDQVIFQLPLKNPGEPEAAGGSGKQPDSSVYYRLTSAQETPEGQTKNTVHVNSNNLPGMGRGAVGPVSGLPVDDKHDVFLLKIGKKCDGDKKRNLELELRTPKMKEPKPPTNEQGSQYCETDCQPEGKRAIKSKGKGKKNKDKGKKGKGKGKK